MRFLIVSAVLACATAAPSGLLAAPYAHGLAAPYGHGLAAPYGHGLAYAAAPLAVAHAAPALPTISPGDLHGAAIEAHVEASDHVRAAVDATRELHDQAAELHGQAVNAAEDHSWQAVDAVKTAEAQLDGAAAGAAPVLAKQLVGHAAPGLVAHSAYAAPPRRLPPWPATSPPSCPSPCNSRTPPRSYTPLPSSPTPPSPTPRTPLPCWLLATLTAATLMPATALTVSLTGRPE
ncbi:hypothetical protein MSG28_015138 [Choristoneura fumiferana]|uniref:Uncharacterized protein n=1 Tax=Choristoneura fumiferana TaxID=7141 RepID=A0ACC0KYL6_CHOFU|nr:hypothetical protein MSG28_015138 [Choristoneura fumiferana]